MCALARMSWSYFTFSVLLFISFRWAVLCRFAFRWDFVVRAKVLSTTQYSATSSRQGSATVCEEIRYVSKIRGCIECAHAGKSIANYLKLYCVFLDRRTARRSSLYYVLHAATCTGHHCFSLLFILFLFGEIKLTWTVCGCAVDRRAINFNCKTAEM